MNIKHFSHNLLKLYQEMSDSFSIYQKSSGWSCLASCGQCCFHPGVEASISEMLPMAFKIYDEGKLSEWVEKLELNSWFHCPVFEPGAVPGQGRCGNYQQRPSLCRMFGVVGLKNKKNEITLSICKTLRQEYSIDHVPTGLDPDHTPIMSDWNYKLYGLSPELIQNRLPIREALLQALNKVSVYAYYHDLVEAENLIINPMHEID